MSNAKLAARDAAAILIANPPSKPPRPWLQLCVGKIREHTAWPNYRIYVWNSDLADGWPVEFAAANPATATVICGQQRMPRRRTSRGSGKHGWALQQLRELAVANGAKYLVTMDNDAHPIRRGWLTDMISKLNEQTVLVGVWREETRVKPFVHPSCLCTTTEFMESHGLRFDTFRGMQDTAADLTAYAVKHNFQIHRLRPSGRRLHFIVGGVYGDTVYHLGCGSRGASFRRQVAKYRLEGRLRDGGKSEKNNPKDNYRAKRLALRILFSRHYDAYIGWLRGLPDCRLPRFAALDPAQTTGPPLTTTPAHKKGRP